MIAMTGTRRKKTAALSVGAIVAALLVLLVGCASTPDETAPRQVEDEPRSVPSTTASRQDEDEPAPSPNEPITDQYEDGPGSNTSASLPNEDELGSLPNEIATDQYEDGSDSDEGYQYPSSDQQYTGSTVSDTDQQYTGPTLSEVDPATFLGKPMTDPEIVEYISQNECESVGMARRCLSSGVEVSYDTGSNVSGMIYFIKGNNLYRPYEGPLPGDLSASDTKADVEQKLGPPVNTGPDWAAYPPQVPGTISLFIEFAPVGGPIRPDSSIREVSFRRYDSATQQAAEALLE